MAWTVGLTKKAQKQLGKLPEDIKIIVLVLTRELAVKGPIVPSWKHFGKLKGRAECYLATSNQVARLMLYVGKSSIRK